MEDYIIEVRSKYGRRLGFVGKDRRVVLSKSAAALYDKASAMATCDVWMIVDERKFSVLPASQKLLMK